MKHIVKRKGHAEHFDERKVYGSAYAACLSAQIPHMEAEKIASGVCRSIKKWIAKKKVVTSNQIFSEITSHLKKYSRATAFMYETHRDIS